MFIMYEVNYLSVNARNAGILVFFLLLMQVASVSGEGVYEVSTLTVTISGPTSVDEGSSANLTVTVTTDNLTDVSIELLSTAGEFGISENGSATDIVSVNGTVDLLYTWIAPSDLVDVVVADITVNVEAESLVANDSLSITVNLVEYGFSAGWDVPAEVNQDELVPVKLNVVDNVTLLPVANADVAFLTEVGVFENGEDLVNVKTDSNGDATASLNLSQAVLISSTQEVAISATVGKNKYAPLETETKVLVTRVLIATVDISSSSLEIDQGESVFITVEAKINGLPWEGATVQAEADGGFFPNGDSLYKAATNASGILVVEWSSEGLPDLTTNTVFNLKIKVISADFDTNETTFEVTVKPSVISVVSLPDLSSTDAVPFNLLWGTLALLPLYRRKKR